MNSTRCTEFACHVASLVVLTRLQSLNDRYPEDSDTCSRKNLWNVETGGACKFLLAAAAPLSP